MTTIIKPPYKQVLVGVGPEKQKRNEKKEIIQETHVPWTTEKKENIQKMSVSWAWCWCCRPPSRRPLLSSPSLAVPPLIIVPLSSSSSSPSLSSFIVPLLIVVPLSQSSLRSSPVVVGSLLSTRNPPCEQGLATVVAGAGQFRCLSSL